MNETPTCPKCSSILPSNAPDGICPKCLMLAGLQDSNAAAFAVTTPSKAAFVPADPIEIVGYFPQLEIIGLLGVGGMGTVYKARQTKLDRLVALKIIRPDSAEDAAFAERFNREAKTLAKLNHPNIVGVHDFGEINVSAIGDCENPNTRLYYFVMEYVDGPNLRELLLEKQLHPDQALAIVPQICDALEFAHNEGVVHRDVKPENILIDSRGRVKIADFGLAKLSERSAESFTLTGTHQVMGTPRYMAPEQMEGSRSVDCRADIYSLGVVFYELLTGELPMGQFEPPSVKSGVDVRLDSVVLRALAREPERRYQNAAALKEDVGAISHVTTASSVQLQARRSGEGFGASTIIEREALAAWRWLAADVDSTSKTAERPQIPIMLMVLLTLAGCCVTLLPWIEVQLYRQGKQFADSVSTNTIQMCVWQEAAPSNYFGYAADVLDADNTVFSGASCWPGLVAGGCFALLILLLISLPRHVCEQKKWLLLMATISVVALVQPYFFKASVESKYVARSFIAADDSFGSDHFVPVTFQDAAAAWDSHVLRNVPHQLQYQSGFYACIGISMSLLVLCATGIRHSLSVTPPATVLGSAVQWPRHSKPVNSPLMNSPQPAGTFQSTDALLAEQPFMFPSQTATERDNSAQRSRSSQQPRFSRKAMIGACLIPFPVLLILASGSASAVGHAGSPDFSSVNSSRSVFVSFLALLMGLFPAILTTLLGSIAVSEIRHSAGRITGLGLAFFDAVLFPTLFVNWMAVLVLGAVTRPYMLSPMSMAILAFFLLTTNALILYRLWSQARATID